MRRYIKKFTPVEAHQWFRNGDHPEDNSEVVKMGCAYTGDAFWSEGKVVRYFRNPRVGGKTICLLCGIQMQLHGWLDNSGEMSTVCPSDWILKDETGQYTICKPDIFEASYEPEPTFSVTQGYK